MICLFSTSTPIFGHPKQHLEEPRSSQDLLALRTKPCAMVKAPNWWEVMMAYLHCLKRLGDDHPDQPPRKNHDHALPELKHGADHVQRSQSLADHYR